jgi:hypothetical protein
MDAPDDDVQIVNAGAGVGQQRQRGRQPMSPIEWFEARAAEYPWIVVTSFSRRVYQLHQRVKCIACSRELQCNNRVQSLTQHAATEAHGTAWTEYLERQRLQQLWQAQHAANAAQPGLTAQRQALLTKARGWLAVDALRHCNKTAMGKLFSVNKIKVHSALQRAGMGISSRSDARIACDGGTRLLRAAIAEKLRGQTFSVMIDEATTTFGGGRRRVLAISLGCSNIGRPILIRLMDEASTAIQMTTAIEEACTTLQLDMPSQAVCLSGDNAPVNRAVAERLGLPFHGCLAHALQLVFKAFVAPFKMLKLVTQGLSTVITSGGGASRVQAVTAVGLRHNGLHMVHTRWNQAQAMMTYLMENDFAVYSTVQELLTSHSAFKSTIDEDVAEGLINASLIRQVKAAFECSVPVGQRKYKAMLECSIVNNRLQTMPALIDAVGADAEHFDVEVIPRIENLRALLQGSTTDLLVQMTLETVFENGIADYSASEKTTLRAEYGPLLMQACHAALAQYDLHVAPALAALKHRIRYDPKTEPAALPLPDDEGDVNVLAVRAFFGCLPSDDVAALVFQWQQYQQHWPLISAAQKALSPARFWRQQPMASWVNLAKLGQWYADVPSSNVAVERVFATMRAAESKLRTHVKLDNAESEMLVKVNAWVIDLMATPIYSELLALDAAMQTAAPAAAAAAHENDVAGVGPGAAAAGPALA